MLDLLLGYIDTSVHFLMFCRSLLLNPKFIYPCADMGEDMVFSIVLAYLSESFEYTPVPYYHYRDNDSSITRVQGVDSYIKRAKQLKANTDLVIDFFARINQSANYYDGLIRLKHRVKVVLWTVIYDKQAYMLWKNFYPELSRVIFYHPMFSIRTKFLYVLTEVGIYPLFVRLKRIVKK